MINKFLKVFIYGLIIGMAPMVWACDVDDDWETSPSSVPTDNPVAQKMYGDYTDSQKLSDLKKNVSNILTVDFSKGAGEGSEKSRKYYNNEDSTMENRNKLRLNAASQAISLGQHAVSLAITSGEDVDKLRVEMENRDDILRMLKGIAKLQAQHLQKTNAITAMRAKLTELSAIDSIVSGSIYTTNPKKSSGSQAEKEVKDESNK